MAFILASALDIEKWDEWVCGECALTHSTLHKHAPEMLHYTKKWASVTQVQIISTFHWRCFPPRMQFISAYTKTALYNFVALKIHRYHFCLAQMKEILGCEFFCNILGCLCVFISMREEDTSDRMADQTKSVFPSNNISTLAHTHTYWLICIIILCLLTSQRGSRSAFLYT